MSLQGIAAAAASGAGMSTIGVAIRGDNASLTRALVKSAVEIDTFERKSNTSAASMSKAWKTGLAVVVVAVLAVVTALASGVTQAAAFEQRMRNVNSIVKDSESGFRNLSSQVLDLSTKLPTGANDLADGLYQVASSGFAGAQGLLVLDAAATAASAGISTTGNAVTAITAVLNAYGMSAASSKDVSDALFQTVNLGVVEFDQLTGVIGDVVGMASAAKVPIQDVGAAIATMTLSGISANEAGTSLNRLLQGLIQPSDALATTYKQLGIESGAVALQTLGLEGVMDKLRTATGGSVEAWLQLFPQVRAARGAFALASNEGKTYANVQSQIGDSTNRLGSTQQVLEEQMKATSNQWKVFTNTLSADAIRIGGQALPAVSSLLTVMQDLAENAIPTLNQGLAVAGPMLSVLHDAGVNVVTILKVLLDTATPIATALGSMVAGATLAGMTVLAETLKAVTGFLADHPALVVAVAALWASRYLPSINQVVQGLQRYATVARSSATSAVGYVTEQIRYQQVLAQGSAFNARTAGESVGNIGRMRAAMAAATTTARGLGTALVASGLATAGLTIGIAAVAYAAQTAADGVKSSISDLTSGLTEFSGPQTDEALAGLTALKDHLDAVAKELQPDGNASWWNIGTSDFMNDKKIVEVNNALADLNGKITNTTVNLTAVSKATGLSVDELTKLQQMQGIDLTDALGTAKAAAGRDQLVAYIKDIEKQTGLSGQAMVGAVGNDIDAWQALSDAVQKATDKATSALASSTNVLGTWKPDIGVKEYEDAVTKAADARERLNTLEHKSKTSADSLISARKDVADAEAAVEKAAAAKAEGTLTATYKRSIELARDFSRNLTTAVQMGLDPKVVSRLLQEGPDQAGPILEQIVADHSGRMVQLVNESEQAIAEISAQVAEQARLTATAVNSTTDQLSKDLPKALDISSMAWAGSTAKDIADKLGLKPEDVLSIAQEFGITIAQGIQQGLDSQGNVRIATGLGGTGGQVPGYYTGGIYPGYTPGRDVGYIGISGGEAIMRPEWARAVGPGFVHKMNAIARSGGISAVQAAMGRYLGGFASGGIAGAYQSPAPQVVTFPVTTRIERNAPLTIQKAYFTDPRAAQRYGDRAQARANRIGG